MSIHLKQKELNHKFLEDLGDCVADVKNEDSKPLECKLKAPFDKEIKAYIFNCTAPPGGRTIDEYKIQLILKNQGRGKRGSFDTSDGKTTLLIGYACPTDDPEFGVWVLFELDKHREFAFSANVQIYLRQLLKAYENSVYVHTKHNKEIVVIAQRAHLKEALQKRFKIDFNVFLEKVENGTKGS